jgi:flagellar hook-basal body complex protein FliE
MPIDPASAIDASDFQISGIDPAELSVEPIDPTQVQGTEGFGTMLGKQIGRLQDLQEDAAGQARALATGTADDPTSVVMAVERARLSMQLASQLRERGTTALQEVLRTQV